MKKSLLYLVLLLVSLSFVNAEEVGTHFKDSIRDDKISVREGTFLDRLDLFAIATRDAGGSYVGPFKPGNTVNFRVDVTSYNLACSNVYIVAEVYNAEDVFKGARSKFIGSISGGNNYFIADIPYTISSSETSFGTWGASGYLWCDNTKQVISKAYSTSFNVNKGVCSEGYTGSSTGRSGLTTSSGNGEDSYRLYIKTDCTSEYRRIDQCTSGEICSGGTCNGVQPPSACGDGQCLGEEDKLNCPSDCTGTITPPIVTPPIVTPPTGGFLGLTTLQIVIIAILLFAIIVIAFMRRK